MKAGGLKVGIVGIPLDVTMKGNSYFKIGLTDQLRSGTISHVQSRSRRHGLDVDVTDLGELVASTYSGYHRAEKMPRRVFTGLADRFAGIVGNFDLVLAYGGVHSAAYVLYNLKGRVERYDYHDDAMHNPPILPSSYMWNAVYSGRRIKHPNQVAHHGKRRLLETDGFKEGLPTEMATGPIFDIDIDYYTQTPLSIVQPSEENRRFAGIRQAIRNARPRVIGVFEYQRLDGSRKGYRGILNLAWEGVAARLNRNAA